MKKRAVVMLGSLLVISLVGCGKKEEPVVVTETTVENTIDPTYNDIYPEIDYVETENHDEDGITLEIEALEESKESLEESLEASGEDLEASRENTEEVEETSEIGESTEEVIEETSEEETVGRVIGDNYEEVLDVVLQNMINSQTYTGIWQIGNVLVKGDIADSEVDYFTEAEIILTNNMFESEVFTRATAVEYEVDIYTPDRFRSDFEIEPSSLGLDASQFLKINVITNVDIGIGAQFFMVDRNNMIIYYENGFVAAKRIG
jgi:hypothetical protein